jgi:hypothetical protein
MLWNTVDYDEIRPYTSLYMAFIVKIRSFYGAVFDVYSSGTLRYTTRRQYSRNTVRVERVIYCQYTILNIAFTGIVMVGLGTSDRTERSTGTQWVTFV